MIAGPTVTILGTRGSLPSGRAELSGYGGDTSCVHVRMCGEDILLDAGTGIMRYTHSGVGTLHVLLSHAHTDHIIGLPCFPPLFDPTVKKRIYLKPRSGLDAAGQIGALMAPPLWPAGIGTFENTDFVELADGRFSIGDVEIDVQEGNHPGGSSIFRLTGGGRSVVYATDFEHGQPHTEELFRFAKGCSLLIYDAHFSDGEYPKYAGWGHSTWQEGARLGAGCGAGKVALTHHHPERTDKELDAARGEIKSINPSCFFARIGEGIILE